MRHAAITMRAKVDVVLAQFLSWPISNVLWRIISFRLGLFLCDRCSSRMPGACGLLDFMKTFLIWVVTLGCANKVQLKFWTRGDMWGKISTSFGCADLRTVSLAPTPHLAGLSGGSGWVYSGDTSDQMKVYTSDQMDVRACPIPFNTP